MLEEFVASGWDRMLVRLQCGNGIPYILRLRSRYDRIQTPDWPSFVKLSPLDC